MSTPRAKKVPRREFEVRRATPDDARAISGILYAAFEPFKSEYTPDAFAYTTPGPDLIEPRFAEGPIWVAVENGRIIGTVSGLADGDRFYIRSMAVRPGLQRGGVGQALLETIEEFAARQGYRRLYLYTTFVLPGARRLYEKNGFYVLRETAPEEWFDMGGLEMEKELNVTRS